MFVITSLFPSDDRKQIVNQQAAIKSWLAAGMKILSLNCPEEIDVLKHDFPEVDFIKAERTGKETFGKPYSYIIDLINAMKLRTEGVFGIINSDVRFRGLTRVLTKVLEKKAENKLLYLRRYDIDTVDSNEGEYFFTGMDAFFLHTKHAGLFSSIEGLVMGQPEWDHRMVYAAVKSGMEVLEIKNPIAYHLKHKQRWTAAQSSALVPKNEDEYYAITCSALSDLSRALVLNSEELVNDDSREYEVHVKDGVYIDNMMLDFMRKQAAERNYVSVKSAMGLGYYHNQEFYRVCVLHGSMKDEYDQACLLINKNAKNESKGEIVKSGLLTAYADFSETSLCETIRGKRFIIYPAGKAGRLMLRCLLAHEIYPMGFADKNPAMRNRRIGKYKVFLPWEMGDPDYVLVVSNLYTDEIVRELSGKYIAAEKIIVV
jgi:hypothetical protein